LVNLVILTKNSLKTEWKIERMKFYQSLVGEKSSLPVLGQVLKIIKMARANFCKYRNI